ncbi:MAG: hypothetical protein KBF33_11675 [Comamonas sp.]|nr:hypothetical protein [Comamonas sp.]
MTAFAYRMQRMNRSIERALANATATWNGGTSFGVMLDQDKDDGFMGDAVTAVRDVVSLCVANTPGIAEGSQLLTINGKACRVAGEVVADAGGWATFPVFFYGGN